jgi:hypothetical protein
MLSPMLIKLLVTKPLDVARSHNQLARFGFI